MATCVTRFNGVDTETLWDTGAEISLITRKAAEDIARAGGQWDYTGRPTELLGVGDGVCWARDRIKCTVELNDGLYREVSLLVCTELPHACLLGWDFMCDNRLAVREGSRRGTLKILRENSQGTFVTAHRTTQFTGPTGQVRQVNASQKRKQEQAIPEDPVEALQAGCYRLCRGKTLDDVTSGTSLRVATDCNKTGEGAGIGSAGESEPCDFPEHQEELDKLLNAYQDIFASKGSDVGDNKDKGVEIRLTSSQPVNIPNYRTPLKLRDTLKELIDELLKAGIIEKCSNTAYNSPCLLVPKKTDINANSGGAVGSQDYRLVVDFRGLNAAIESVNFPIPRIDDILVTYRGCKVFSGVDIRHAFYTVRLDPDSRHLTAFSCEFGKWQFKFLPQGLKISPAVFQQRISDDLAGLERTLPYIDDISLGDPDVPTHLKNLEALFQRIRKHGYKLKRSKCQFLKKAIVVTGKLLSAEGVAVTPDKIKDVDKLRAPTNVSGVKSLLGFTGFLRAHVPYYCEIVRLLQTLVVGKKGGKHNIEREWTATHDKAIHRLKEALKSPKVLAFPDPSQRFILYTDASKFNMSGVLMQGDMDKLKPVGYWSKAFKGAQLAWSALVKEARAIYEAVLYFSVYIKGCEVTVMCDHEPLRKFFSRAVANEMVNRWSLTLQEYNLTFERVSSENNVSDCLSRDVSDGIMPRGEILREGLYTPHDTPIHPTDEFQKCSKDLEKRVILTVATGNVDTPTTREKGTRYKYLWEPLPEDGVTIIDTPPNLTSVSPEIFKRAQENDHYCKRILKDRSKFKPDNGTFTVSQGLLYKVCYNTTEGQKRLPHLALVIPKELQLTILYKFHSDLLHPGRDKMMWTMETRFYWKGMRAAVARFVEGCRICAWKRMGDPQYTRLHHKQPKGPLQTLAVDLWSPGKAEGNLALTAMDLYSNYPFLEPIADKTEASVVPALKKILSLFKTPESILADNGGEFISKGFKRLLEDRGIKLVYTCPHYPQGNAILERWHRFLNEVIRQQSDLGYGNWEEGATAALSVYRILPHTTTRESPLFLMTGQDPSYHLDKLLPTRPKELWNDVGPPIDMLGYAAALGRANVARGRLRNKKMAALEQRPLRPNDRVLRKNPTPSKLAPKWLSGYRVLEVLGKRAALVLHTGTRQKFRVNFRHLRLVDPLDEILQNSNLDVSKGASVLYWHGGDFKDLMWPAPDDNDITTLDRDRLREVVRDREDDQEMQERRPREEREREDVRRPQRDRRPPRRYRNALAVSRKRRHSSRDDDSNTTKRRC